MKTCVTCGKQKADDEFNWRYSDKGIRHKICRDYQNSHPRNWYETHKEIHKQNVALYNHEYRKNPRVSFWSIYQLIPVHVVVNPIQWFWNFII